jgi:hypothetical protein
MTVKRDTRIAYGTHCTWWDSIHRVGRTDPGVKGLSIPCCPHCGSTLFEFDHPGYRRMMEWARGKCFPTMSALQSAYEKENRRDH